MTGPTGELAPTQTKHPARATLRTAAALIIGLAGILPVIVHEMGWDGAAWLAVPLAVASAITRIIAMPQVNEWLRQVVPFLAAKP